MRGISVCGIAFITVSVFMLLAQPGCSRESAGPGAANPPQAADTIATAGFSIPAPEGILRSAAALSQTRYIQGAGYDNLLPWANVAPQDTAALFTPGWQPGDPNGAGLAYAIYRFNVLDYSGADGLHYAFDTTNWNDKWIGVPDLSMNRWRWHRLADAGPLDLGGLDGMADETGGLLVVVVLTGTAPARLEWLRTGADIMPEAMLSADPSAGAAPLLVNFDASGSADAEGPLELFEWDWDGDGVYEEDTGATPAAQHTFTGTGTVEPAVRVTDSAGNQATAAVPIQLIGGEPCWHITEVGVNANHVLMNLSGKPAIVYATNAARDQLVFRAALDAYGAAWADPVDVCDARLQEGELLIAGGKPALAYIRDGGSFTSTVSFVSARDAAGSAWNEPVDLATGLGNPYMSAAIIGGNPAVCFSAPDERDALYFRRAADAAGTTWDAPVAATSAVYQAYSLLSMAEVNGNPAICFFDDDEYLGYVRAANAGGTAWDAAQTGLTASWLGFGLTLCVVNGNPAICYADDMVANMYMRSTDANGTAWGAPVVVDDAGEVWNECCMAVVNGVPAISYTGGDTPPQIYCCESDDADGTTWTRNEPVSPAETEDWDSRLIDLNGMPALTYVTDTEDPPAKVIYFAAYY